MPGWPLKDGLVYSLADEDAATMRERWHEQPTRAERLVAQDIDLAASSATDRFGRLIGPMGVRFILVPVTPAATPGGPVTPPALLDSLDRQLDLRRVELGDDSLVAYENMAWLPVRATASGATAAASRQAGPEALIRSDFSDAEPALPGALPTAGAGPVQGESVLLAEAVDPRWELTVDGTAVARRTAFGWATAWDLAAPGQGSFRYRTAASRYAIVLVQILLGVLALLLIRTWRHGPPFGRYLARRRVAASPATTVIDLTAEPPDAGAPGRPGAERTSAVIARRLPFVVVGAALVRAALRRSRRAGAAPAVHLRRGPAGPEHPRGLRGRSALDQLVLPGRPDG